MHRSMLVLSVGLVAAQLWGCTSSSKGGGGALCTTDSDCGSGPHCIDGYCTSRVDAGSEDASHIVPDGGRRDAGHDAGPVRDAGPTDAGSTDAGSVDAPAVDAGALDAGSVDAAPVCSPGAMQTDTRACGGCGLGTQMRTRTCGSSGTWGAWSGYGSCTGGGCMPGATRSCGTGGTQTCSSACTWCGCLGDLSSCSGTAGTWAGCRGTGCSVCTELVSSYPCYFDDHPGCVSNSTCAGSYNMCNAKCPAPTAEDSCMCTGTGSFSGCRGNGCAVCTELVAGYACYFVNHPACHANDTCGGTHSTCSAVCPAPTAADMGSP